MLSKAELERINVQTGQTFSFAQKSPIYLLHAGTLKLKFKDTGGFYLISARLGAKEITQSVAVRRSELVGQLIRYAKSLGKLKQTKHELVKMGHADLAKEATLRQFLGLDEWSAFFSIVETLASVGAFHIRTIVFKENIKGPSIKNINDISDRIKDRDARLLLSLVKMLTIPAIALIVRYAGRKLAGKLRTFLVNLRSSGNDTKKAKREITEFIRGLDKSEMTHLQKLVQDLRPNAA